VSFRIALTAGGTGGHIMPGIALAKEFSTRDCEMIWIGAEGGLESDVVPRNGIAFHSCGMKRISGGLLPLVRRGFGALAAIPKSSSILKSFKPDAVIGLGGYASVPTLAACRLKGIPYFLLEQNAFPGRVTRNFASSAKRVFGQFAEATERLSSEVKFEHTGTPLRDSISGKFSDSFTRDFAHGEVLLVLGGSQGSRALNATMAEAISTFELEFPGFRVIHITGKDDFESVHSAYKSRANCDVFAFRDDMHEVYAKSTVALTRAGAVTLAELAVAGLPAVIVPFPQAADNHQRANAEVFRRAGAARIVQQRELNAKRLIAEFKDLCQNPQTRSDCAAKMRSLAKPNASSVICNSVLEFLDSKGPK
jgi:UDP-N-acetylglucosamine--N-acetylmuramyl-(pentapeptide) pyrophosphoryl-undecaprenol N-acetylglucosamine transferase